MKVMLAIGIYLSLIVVMGFVLAWMAPDEALGHEVRDDDL